MEVLRPQLINIEGRIYRKNLVREPVHQGEDIDVDFSADFAECADELCDDFTVEETERGFRATLEIPSQLFKYIIGKKSETKRRLESETRTSISFPKPGMEGEIVITGQYRKGVISARTQIEVLAEDFRKKQPFTHFLSFALNQPAIQDRFQQFKEQVLDKCSKDRGVDGSIFQNPAKLHLTIGTLVLLSEQEVQQACELLQKCKADFISQISGGKPLKLEVTGIEYMNDDPAMVDVLYAKVRVKDGSEKLQLIADRLVDRFVNSEFMQREWDRVKLHATVMNTLFRRDPNAEEGPGRPGQRPRESFDARNVLRFFANFHFGALDLESAQLSQRYSVDSSGYYASSGQVSFV